MESAGSLLLKGIVALSLVGVGSFALKGGHEAHNNYLSTQAQIKSTQQELRHTKRQKPRIKDVNSAYQQALNAGNRLNKIDNQLRKIDQHKQPQQWQAKYNELTDMFSDSTKPNGPLVSPSDDFWDDGQVTYGGENSYGRVNMSIRWYDKTNHKLMAISTMQYSPKTGKISGYVNYMTKDGLNEVRANWLKKGGNF